MKNYPCVAIVGRANVGKSSIFNSLLGRGQAVIAKEAGTTRDPVQALLKYDKKAVRLIDTAGLKNPEDDFEETIQDQIEDATSACDLIMVVVDASTIVTEEDMLAAKKALKSQKPVLLVINKVDQAHNKSLDEFKKLGIENIIETSATQKRGIEELKELIADLVKPIKIKKRNQETISVSLIGRPNVGKSHLFNSLAKKQQAIVASKSGTTRDINRMEVTYHSRRVEFLDTAGIRKQSKIDAGAEKFSVIRTVYAIENSDISILLLDPHELVTNLDKKIAGMVKDAGKGLILAVNKWDLVEKDEDTQGRIGSIIGRELQFVWWAPLIFLSAETGNNVTKLYELILEINEELNMRLNEEELTEVIRKLFKNHKPPTGSKKEPKLESVKQTSTRPMEISISGPTLKDTHWSYKRYIENGIRENFEIYGVPINLNFRNKER